jgi:hypothetical protein
MKSMGMTRRQDFIRSYFLFAFLYAITFFSIPGFAQVDVGSFQSVQLAHHAQLSGTGGINVSLTDRDVNFFTSNPALNSDSLNGQASASYLFYFADIGMASFSHQRNWGKWGPVSIAIQHLSLGSIQGYDITGVPTGTFSSGETAITIGKSHQAGHFRIGVNMKGVFSSISGYRASALLFDVGGLFVHPTQKLTVGLVIKNAGFILRDYSATSASKVPFDVQAGISFKPAHMPLRFSFTAHHLRAFDVVYYDPASGDEKPSTLDKVLSHLNFGAEILLHKNINALVGYHFLKHHELQLDNSGAGSGLSIGVVAKVKNSELAASRTGYVTGGAYQVTVSSNIDKLINR